MKPADSKQPKKSQKATKKAGQKAEVKGLVKQAHGGAIYQGPPANPVAGPGRPKDELREKLREIGLARSVPLLDAITQGKVKVSLIGTCPKCKHVGELPDGDDIDALMDTIRATVDQQLKASDQALKYGLGTKDEIDINHPTFQSAASQYLQCTDEALDRHVSPQVKDAIKATIHQLLQERQLGGGQ